MAIYNEILHGRFARALQKTFGTKAAVPAKQLAGEIMPVHGLFTGAENRYLEQWQRFGFGGTAAAGAGNLSGFLLRNPGGGAAQLSLLGGSDLIVVVESVILANTTSQQLEVQTGAAGIATDYSTVLSPQNLDLRYGQLTGSAVKLTSGNKAGGQQIGTNLYELGLAAATSFPLIANENQELVLVPGAGFMVQGLTANTQFLFGIIWRQRFLEEAERP